MLALNACIEYTIYMQYTIRGIPALIDQALRERAKVDGKSLNEAAIQALAEGVGVSGRAFVRRDITDIAGTWKKDAAFEKAISDQEKIDESLWK